MRPPGTPRSPRRTPKAQYATQHRRFWVACCAFGERAGCILHFRGVRGPAARTLRALLLAAVVSIPLSACGGSDEASGEVEFPTEGGTLRPEDVRASAAEVAAGLAEIRGYADEVAAALPADQPRAAAAEEKIEPVWESILGTVKSNDEAAHDAFEESFAAIASALAAADAAAASAAAAEIAQGAQDYLADYPGASPGTGSPTSDPVVGY